MLDIKEVVKNPQLFKNSLEKRGVSSVSIDNVIDQENNRKKIVSILDTNNADLKKLALKIRDAATQKNDALVASLKKEVSDLKNKNSKLKTDLTKTEGSIREVLLSLPNLLDPTTPEGAGEEDNVEVLKNGKIPSFNFKVKNHVELGEDLNLLDFEKASKITGSRFVVYKKDLARLERALINFFLEELNKENYEETIPPFICHERSLEGTGQLPKFKQDLFKIENTDWYLIPTSEVPLTNLKREELFEGKELPLKYTAATPCFRSEAGAHGKDTKGLIRLHQFNKVEMVQITAPESSEKAHEAMVATSEALLQKLGLPYRKMLLCSKDIGFGAKKCYDLEVWIPSQQKYREISSISNCGDFQARRAGIRFRGDNKKPVFAHTLNGSALAVGRTVVAIMENYQNEDGSINIPECLQPFMGGQTVIKS